MSLFHHYSFNCIVVNDFPSNNFPGPLFDKIDAISWKSLESRRDSASTGRNCALIVIYADRGFCNIPHIILTNTYNAPTKFRSIEFSYAEPADSFMCHFVSELFSKYLVYSSLVIGVTTLSIQQMLTSSGYRSMVFATAVDVMFACNILEPSNFDVFKY